MTSRRPNCPGDVDAIHSVTSPPIDEPPRLTPCGVRPDVQLGGEIGNEIRHDPPGVGARLAAAVDRGRRRELGDALLAGVIDADEDERRDARRRAISRSTISSARHDPPRASSREIARFWPSCRSSSGYGSGRAGIVARREMHEDAAVRRIAA